MQLLYVRGCMDTYLPPPRPLYNLLPRLRLLMPFLDPLGDLSVFFAHTEALGDLFPFFQTQHSIESPVYHLLNKKYIRGKNEEMNFYDYFEMFIETF